MVINGKTALSPPCRSFPYEKTPPMTVGYPRVTLDCYVRATAPGTLVDDVLDTVRTYEEEELIDEYVVEFWPDEIRLIDETAEGSVRSRYQQFQAWADREDVSLEPAFTHQERTTPVSDDSDTFLVLPILVLGIRVNGELVSVAPHITGTTLYPVREALADVKSLPRVDSKDIAELSPDHPLRSILASHFTKNVSTEDTGAKMLTEQ